MRVPQLAAPAPRPGPGEVQLVLGAGEADVAEPPLLLERRRAVPPRARAGRAVLQPGQHHDGPLEALGGVQRHEGHAVLARRRSMSLPEQERRLGEEPLQRRATVRRPPDHLRPVGRARHQFAHVLPAIGALGPFGHEHLLVLDGLDEPLEHVGRRQASGSAPRASRSSCANAASAVAHVGPELGRAIGGARPRRAAACFHVAADLGERRRGWYRRARGGAPRSRGGTPRRRAGWR